MTEYCLVESELWMGSIWTEVIRLFGVFAEGMMGFDFGWGYGVMLKILVIGVLMRTMSVVFRIVGN